MLVKDKEFKVNTSHLGSKIGKKNHYYKETTTETIAAKLTKKQILSHSVNKIIAGAGYSHLRPKFTKQLFLSCSCARDMEINEEMEVKIGSTCKKRWCQRCGALRSFSQGMRYAPVIERLQNLSGRGAGRGSHSSFYMVTLTTPRVFGWELKERLDQMAIHWRYLYKESKRKKMPFHGLRKLEITTKSSLIVDPKTKQLELFSWLKNAKNQNGRDQLNDNINRTLMYAQMYKKEVKKASKTHGVLQYFNENLHTYHPHFHILIQGYEAAHFVKKQWLKRFKNARKKSQKIEKYTGDIREFTKYIAKNIDASKGKNAFANFPYATAIAYIYFNMVSRRSLFAFGDVLKNRATNEDVENWLKTHKEAIEKEFDAEIDENCTDHLELKKYKLDAKNKAHFSNCYFKYDEKSMVYVEIKTGECLTTLDEFDPSNPNHLDPEKYHALRAL